MKYATIREEMDAQIRCFQRWVHHLERKRRSPNPPTHWKARGSQAALERVAKQMQRMRAWHISSYMLYKVLNDYLECLNKSIVDACEESKSSGQRTPIERWKAQGEAQVLSRICAALGQLVANHAPGVDPYPLSLNGKNLELELTVFQLGE